MEAFQRKPPPEPPKPSKDLGSAQRFRRIAVAGRTLTSLVRVNDISNVAPKIVCELCDAEAAALLVMEGDPSGPFPSWGREELLPKDALMGVALRVAAEGPLSSRLFALSGEPIEVVAAPINVGRAIAAGNDTWVLVAVHRAEVSPEIQAALEAAAALIEAHLSRAIEGEKPRSQPIPSIPRALPANERSGMARIAFDDLIGQASSFLECIEIARRAARSEMPILVTGETGTGKEMMAQAIHNASERANEPFVGINVAAIPRELLESELFGYERGAFTGARSAGKPGLFELAGEGTLLLDEIGDMSLDLQVKLLRVLQERVVQRVGGTRSIPILARTVATTHRDLKRASEEGIFRADLYYRLRGVQVRVPSLRDRPSDIPILVDACLTRWSARTGRPKPMLDPKVMAAYYEHDWPGNVRELMHLVEAEASVLAPSETIIRRVPTISRRVYRTIQTPAPPSSNVARADTIAPSSGVSPGPLDDVERRAYREALSHHGGNVSKAARALGVSRSTMYVKMRRYGLDAGQSGEGEGNAG